APGNSQVVSGEQSNSSMLFDNKFFLKLYRKIEDGLNPDVEINRFLTEQTEFPNVPGFVGAIEYRRAKAEPTVVCMLQRAAVNEGDVWTRTVDAVGRYYERVLERKADLQNETVPPGALLDELIGGIYPEKVKLFGQRTGELHLGQLLYTGKDFVILDFEGEPARPLSDRKLKRSALRDVAGMMRSFQYAAYSALWQPAMRKEDVPFLEHWADLWYRQMSSVFLE